MNNLPLSQQAASSANISTPMLDIIQSGEKSKPGKGLFKGKIARAVSAARKRAQDKGNIITGSSALKQPLQQLREAGEQGLRKHGKKSWNNGVLNALINPPLHFRNNQQRVNWLNKQVTLYLFRVRPGNNAAAPVHGVARLQVLNGVVSGGTADIDQYLTAAAVSGKKLVLGVSVLV